MARQGIVFLAALIFFCGGIVALAEENVKQQVVEREISGEVSAISSRFIAVVYAQDERAAYEMGLNMDQTTRTSGNRKISDIGTGDIVRVVYEEIIEMPEGQKSRVVTRLARFVEVRRQAERRPESGAMVTQEQ